MAILMHTIKQHVRILIVKKTFLLLGIGAVLGVLCYISSSNDVVASQFENARIVYTIGSVVLSLGILAFIAYKIRYFHNLFGKEWTGTVIKAETTVIGTHWSKGSIRSANTFVLVVKIDGAKKNKKFSFNPSKVSPKVYLPGDRIRLIKGTRYPINLTREKEQHICPICARNSCFSDHCPDCNLKY